MNARTSQRRPDVHARASAWLLSHARSLVFSLGKLYRTPLSSLMTTAVIGIALALPTGMYLMLSNLEAISGGWDESAQVSLFLKPSVSDEQAEELARQIQRRDDVGSAQAIGKAAALAEFRELSGFGAALDALDGNPLPAVVVVQPGLALKDPLRIQQLVYDLEREPGVERAQLDLQWVQRLYAIMETAQRGVLVIGIMLGLAVLLVVGNTIRLDIQNRRDEIEVAKLIGATDAFIRRPFLYGGIWYGVIGGLLGLIMVEAALGFLAAPVNRLAGLYGGQYQLLDLGAGAAFSVLLIAMALGLGGSWLAVGRHLSDIEPR
ncbi:MAG TPA: cell division protein FtsX [Thioalkalivibrio sp.]|nr:cell division protein FtsX [Thioalkalivibrio sp.]